LSRRSPANPAASVRQRLLNLSRSTGEPFDLVLTRYALERLLYRLGVSAHADQFILKGAMLVATWAEIPHRPTRDLDLTGYGDTSDEQLTESFQNICRVEAEPDGLVFDGNSMNVAEIRGQEEYDGRRLRFNAYLGKACIPLQVDIGFGDAVTPEPHEISYPTILDFPAPRVRAYPCESVVSEKLQAMVALGMVNSRMKDFYDIWVIARQFEFRGETLVEAIRATFDRRATSIPKETPTALSDEFATNREKHRLWQAFLERAELTGTAVDFPRVIDELRQFALPPLLAAANRLQFDRSWKQVGWQ